MCYKDNATIPDPAFYISSYVVPRGPKEKDQVKQTFEQCKRNAVLYSWDKWQ
jgi:hypothetical protein